MRWRGLLPALCICLCAAHADAQQAPDGYAFHSPRVVAQQRLFGIAHATSLLAAACADEAEGSKARAAYALWRTNQAATIGAATADLGTYYFGDAAASPAAVAQRLGLKPRLQDMPREALLAACDTLPEALVQPRYDLATLFRLEELMVRIVAMTEVAVRHDRCRALFPAEQQELHESRYATWQEINAGLLEETRAALAAAWPPEGRATSFDAWHADLKRRIGKWAGTPGDCQVFSESLKHPNAALREAFRMPPHSRGLPQ